MNTALVRICRAALTALLAAAGAQAASSTPAPQRDACQMLLAAGARELLGSRDLSPRSIEAPMPGPACELHPRVEYGRSVFLLIGGEKGSTAAKDWFEQERSKTDSSSPYREDRTFGFPAYSMADVAKSQAELVVLKGDLIVAIHWHAPGANLEKLRAFARRILESL